MKTRLTFSRIMETGRRDHVERLIDRAVTANRLAKRASGKAQRQFYAVKNKALNQLLRIGAARLDSFFTWPEPLIGLTLAGGQLLHTKPEALTFETMGIVVEQVEELIQTEARVGSPAGGPQNDEEPR